MMCRYGDPFMEGTYICTFLYIGKFEECTAIPEDDNVSGIRICAKYRLLRRGNALRYRIGILPA